MQVARNLLMTMGASMLFLAIHSVAGQDRYCPQNITVQCSQGGPGGDETCKSVHLSDQFWEDAPASAHYSLGKHVLVFYQAMVDDPSYAQMLNCVYKDKTDMTPYYLLHENDDIRFAPYHPDTVFGKWSGKNCGSLSDPVGASLCPFAAEE